MRLSNRSPDTLELFQMVVARGCRKSGEGNIGLSEGLASDWRVINFDLLRLLAALQLAVVHRIGNLKPTGFFARVLTACLDRFPSVPIFFVISCSYRRTSLRTWRVVSPNRVATALCLSCRSISP
jgi:hypothetical protein